MRPRVMKVIEVDESRGKGIEGDPYRHSTCYYTLNGKFLAENDSYATEQLRRADQRDSITGFAVPK